MQHLKCGRISLIVYMTFSRTCRNLFTKTPHGVALIFCRLFQVIIKMNFMLYSCCTLCSYSFKQFKRVMCTKAIKQRAFCMKAPGSDSVFN